VGRISQIQQSNYRLVDDILNRTSQHSFKYNASNLSLTV
jgi:hypothetical protein